MKDASDEQNNNNPGEDDGAVREQVFEISSDFDIKPVKDDTAATNSVTAKQAMPATPTDSWQPGKKPIVFDTNGSITSGTPSSPLQKAVENLISPETPGGYVPGPVSLNIPVPEKVSPPEKPPETRTTKPLPPQETEPLVATTTATTRNSPGSFSEETTGSPANSAAIPKEKINFSASSIAEPDNEHALPRIRTYEGDVAETLAHRHVSATTVALAENKKSGVGERLGSPTISGAPTHTLRNAIFSILSITLVAGGAIGGYYLYGQSPLAASTPVSTSNSNTLTTSLIQADSSSLIKTDNLSAGTILAAIKAEIAKSQAPGTIKEIILVNTASDGTISRLPIGELLSTFAIPAPNLLSRTLTNQWMLGVSTDSSGQKTPFVIVTTNFFQNAFAGMLQWESSMASDLAPYLNLNTQVSSSAPLNNPLANGSFRDEIVQNKDVRAFVTKNGETAFVYSFLDNNTLAITGNDQALSQIISRLEQRAFVR